MAETKNIYKGDEFKFSKLFENYQTRLRDEFLNNNPGFLTSKEIDYQVTKGEARGDAYEKGNVNRPDSWNVLGIRSLSGKTMNQDREKYPAAFELVDMFGDACTMATYSIFEPKAILRRHTGPENRDAKNVRIHVPLIIPKGDIGIEIHGEEMHWDCVFAFNNQKAHSVWNFTDERRLVFLIDLTREVCELPPAPAWYPGCNDNAPRFPKTETEGNYWKNTAITVR